jgi:GxxExxY protein
MVELDEITEKVIGGAIDVHRAMGPGLLESVYQTCMLMELMDRGLDVEAQKVLPAFYKRRQIDCVYRADMIVEGRVVVELKSVNQLEPVHSAQLLTYVRLSACEAGLLINFNVDLLKNGVRRVRNFHHRTPPLASPPP